MKENKHFLVRPLIVGALVIGASVYLFLICLAGLNHPYIEYDWLEAPGKVLSKDIKLTGAMNERRALEGYEQLINYEYMVGDRTFQSNVVSVQATVDLKDYPEGKVITVYYNPAKPNESVIIRSKTQKAYLYATMLFAVVLIASVVFNLFNLIKNR